MDLAIFAPEASIPKVDLGDVIFAHSVKVSSPARCINTLLISDCFSKLQNRGGDWSLLTNRGRTTLHIYSAPLIPRPPESAAKALRTPVEKGRVPNAEESAYVSWLYSRIDKSQLPTKDDFQVKVAKSLNVKDKFSVLKDVREHNFVDLVVRVVKDPFYSLDKATVWVTDYTENDAFYDHPIGASVLAESGPDGDPFGYQKKKRPDEDATTAWPGPYGKRSLQMTCYPPHAGLIYEQVKAGSWVYFRNVQIKFGANNQNLEGFLRCPLNGSMGKVQVEVLDPTADPENINPRLKDAIRRRRDYEKEVRTQKRQLNEVLRAPQFIPQSKRPAEDSVDGERSAKLPKSSRQRRKERRKAKQREKAGQDALDKADSGHPLDEDDKKEESSLEARLQLNPYIICENAEKPLTRMSRMLQSYTLPDGCTLPFINAKYRTVARVINFYPPCIEDFAVCCRTSEFDVLSDGGNSDSDSDAERLSGNDMDGGGDGKWEWRFALLLEDAFPSESPSTGTSTTTLQKPTPARIWVMVDNASAQLLTSLDASPLRRRPEDLSILREHLFSLWGDLEELKLNRAMAAEDARRRQKSGLTMPPDSSPPTSEHDAAAISAHSGFPNAENATAARSMGGSAEETEYLAANVKNMPFACCIQQYGVSEDRLVTDTNGKEETRWTRMFGLFGTKIKVA